MSWRRFSLLNELSAQMIKPIITASIMPKINPPLKTPSIRLQPDRLKAMIQAVKVYSNFFIVMVLMFSYYKKQVKLVLCKAG
jgi:hypothetical protein